MSCRCPKNILVLHGIEREPYISEYCALQSEELDFVPIVLLCDQIAMFIFALSALLAAVAGTWACTPGDDPPTNDISVGFAIQVQNASYPAIHNHRMNFWEAGGGDGHLYVSPAGNSTGPLTMVDGVLMRGGIHAVINGEVRQDP